MVPMGAARRFWARALERSRSTRSLGVFRPDAVLAHEHFLKSLRDALMRRDQLED